MAKNNLLSHPDRPLLDLGSLPLPDRKSRLTRGFSILGMPGDVAETTRGCPNKCKFCSITRMYGNSFRKFPIERVLRDLRSIRDAGTKAVFFADDNISWDATHFRQVCQAISRNGLNDLTYVTQLSALSIAENPEIVADMERANFRVAFVGFESMLPEALKGMKKPANPEINRQAAALLRRHHIAIFAGFIVGYPEDTRESVKKQFELIRQLKPDAIYASIMTPLPKTVLRQEMLEAGLVTNPDDYRRYDGFSANIRTNHLSQRELERTQKIEALRFCFYPSVVFNNTLLKDYMWEYLGDALKVITGAIRDLRRPTSRHQLDL